MTRGVILSAAKDLLLFEGEMSAVSTTALLAFGGPFASSRHANAIGAFGPSASE